MTKRTGLAAAGILAGLLPASFATADNQDAGPSLVPVSVEALLGVQSASYDDAKSRSILALGFELSDWLTKSRFNSWVGVEGTFELGFGFGTDFSNLFGYYAADPGLNLQVHRWGEHSRLLLHANLAVQGHGDVDWDSGARLSSKAGLRAITFSSKHSYFFDYAIGTPVAWVDDAMPGADRIEHHLLVRRAGVEPREEGRSITVELTVGVPEDAPQLSTDFRLMLVLGANYQ